MVLIATLPDGHSVALKVADWPTPEDLRRLAGLQSMPGMADAVWTGRAGTNVR